MITIRSGLTLLVCALLLNSPSANAQSPLSVCLGTDEDRVAADHELHLALGDDLLFMQINGSPPPGVNYEWQVSVTSDDQTIGLAEAGITGPVDEPTLKIDALLVNSTYSCVLKRTLGEKTSTYKATITVPIEGSAKSIEEAVSFGESQRTDTSAVAERRDEIDAAADDSVPELLKGMPLNDRFVAARAWADAIQLAAKDQQELIIPVSFFRDKLEKNEFGKERKGVAWLDSRRALTSQALYRQLVESVNAAGSASSSEKALNAWNTRRATFERQMDAGISDGGLNLPALIQSMWKVFLNAWAAEVESKELSPTQTATAIKQAAVTIVGIVAGIDDAAIAAAIQGTRQSSGGQQTQRGSSSYSQSSSSGYYSHAALRHLRIMSRMHRRHAVHRARWGY